MDEPVDRGAVLLSAGLTIRQHHTGRCPQCGTIGCPQLTWAWAAIADDHRRRAAIPYSEMVATPSREGP